MAGYRPKPSPGGATPSRIPPAGGGGVARPNDARGLRAVPRIAAVIVVGGHVARLDPNGRIIAASSAFRQRLHSEHPDTIEVTFTQHCTPAAVERVDALLAEAADKAHERVAVKDCERRLATAGEAPLDDWGSSEYPDERVRADRRAARGDRPDPFLRAFRAYVAFLQRVFGLFRDHPYATGVPIILIATGQLGRWVGGIDWPVVIVSTLIVLAGVFVVALSVSRRNYRREIEAERAALAERAQKQYEEWLKE
ncbi:hypothetical protein SEA_AFFECA_6 [Gordonia phage Affeca]|nr:hypothetical protein SEA_AFFECA_6 [Gordonia phage Affeca]